MLVVSIDLFNALTNITSYETTTGFVDVSITRFCIRDALLNGIVMECA